MKSFLKMAAWEEEHGQGRPGPVCKTIKKKLVSSGRSVFILYDVMEGVVGVSLLPTYFLLKGSSLGIGMYENVMENSI